MLKLSRVLALFALDRIEEAAPLASSLRKELNSERLEAFCLQHGIP